MFFSSKEEVEYLTPLWKGERMDDGRPKVSDSIIERMRNLTLEEVWSLPWSDNYEFQIETEFKTTHSTVKPLVGRALTIQCMPTRPDLHEVTKAESKAFGFEGHYNKSAVGRLVRNDVMVVDFYDKIEYGTYFGGNLSTAVANRTQGGGAVIWGGIRDVDQVKDIPNLQIYYRGSHPTAIRDYVMTGYNRPTMIGRAVAMPGDVVFGSAGGVAFIPCHMAEQTVDRAEKFHIKDIFGFERLRERKYTPSQIDNPWTREMWDDFQSWFKTSGETENYRYLDFSQEIEVQLSGDGAKRKNRHRDGLPYNP
jgi:regulator of RNase E activity RraA